ncbi:hypothetical protein EV424DRAFT_421435 [Suillus variegatus]|nr:hypothetical protein EV424DRAFT_421435 [Suillus variegatus]
MAFVVLLMYIVGHKYHSPKRAQGTIFEVVTLALLIGVTFGAFVVAFEASSDKLAATRLHLLSPPSTQHIIHVFSTADPIPTSVCISVASSCGIAGYAMETCCHLGKAIRYHTVTHLGWIYRGRTRLLKSLVNC